MKSLTLLFSFILAAAAAAPAQSSQQQYLNALDDWHDGDYSRALSTFIDLMSGPESGDWLERIALQTGELYKVTELSEDGTAVRFDGSGRYAIYERPQDGLAVTRIHDLESGAAPLEISGEDLQMTGNGGMVFMRLAATPEVREAEQKRNEQVDRARQTNDRDLWIAALREYERVIAVNTRLMYRRAGESRAADITPEGLTAGEMVAAGEWIYVVGQETGAAYSDLYALNPETGALQNLTRSSSFESGIRLADGGNILVFEYAPRNPLNPAAEEQPAISGSIGILDRSAGTVHTVEGELEDVSRARKKALVMREGENLRTLTVVGLEGDFTEREIISTEYPVADPALSPEGTRVAYTIREQDDWEVYVHDAGGANRRRVTRELQHDRFPFFLSEDRLIAAKGEGRHRRSFLYDLATGKTEKLFHNNTVRTIAPEYQWAVSPAGNRILIVAERDGDTISPERGVYLLELDRRIGVAELTERLERNLAAEQALREKGRRLYERIASDVQAVVDRASRNRVYTYENDLYKFDSKYISQPGNDRAAEYLYNTYASFGYQPEYQWFTPEGRNVYGGRTANVLARLEGTENPELVYVVSSHYDSVERGPGADDNTSGTAALLEAARILADHPQPCTIIFASFTGEEAGLLGSREFVRQAQAEGMKIVGALNNDMVGMANDSRLDNTIRYSNPGIRDIQHAAAFLFSDMVTYDALYYKSTDAHAYYEAYGDIVGGIGSYPVLGNPFYHQWNDNLETINHQLVTEVAKTTAATLMLLASSPSRIGGLTAEASGTNGGYTVRWNPSPEAGVTEYLVRYEDPEQGVQTVRTDGTGIELPAVKAGTKIRVKAVNSRGQEGWDWAAAEI